MMKNVRLQAKGLYKIFGPTPEKVFPLIEQGLHKDEIFKQTGHTVGVNNASFEVYEGEIFVVMGLSGSGKSTLVRLLNRLIEPSLGEVFIDNENITEMDDASLRHVRRKKMSMVFQSFALMPHMTILDNTAFGLVLDGIDKNSAHEKSQQALSQVGLETHQHAFPDELSGGMQQRVGIARALATGSNIMLMDEAFSALDPIIRTEMQDELLKLQHSSRHTIIFISHDLDEAIRIGDRIAIMEGGDIVQIGTPEEILNNPANDYVASFFKGVSIVDILTVGHMANKTSRVIPRANLRDIKSARTLLEGMDEDFAYLIDDEEQFIGLVTADSLMQAQKDSTSLYDAVLEAEKPVPSDTLLSGIISMMAETSYPIPVVDNNQHLLGVISRSRLLKALAPD